MIRKTAESLELSPFLFTFAPSSISEEKMIKDCRLFRIMTWLAGLLLTASVAMAESEKMFYVYNAANGLADNSAQTINCTKTGRLVITTMGQINFFDGQQFNFIDPSSENTYPLSKYNGHAHLYFDKHHHLWLKKRHMVTCVDLSCEMFVPSIVDVFHEMGVDDKVEDLFADTENHLWLLLSKGLYHVEGEKFYKVRSDLNLQDVDTYQNKYLLLFYENGLMDVLELETGETAFSEKAYDNKKVDRYSHTSVTHPVGNSIFQIRNGTINGNSTAILLRFDMIKRKWDTILETPYYLSNMVDRDSLLYIPSAYGYWTYDIVTGEKKHIEELQMADGKRLLTDINCMEFDRQGGLWLGTEKRGLLYARPYNTPFNAYKWTDQRALDLCDLMDRQLNPQDTYREKSVNCVFRDSRGWDWVGTSMGLQLYRSSSARLPQLYTRNDGLLNNVIHCIQEDRDHNIWVGTSYGICCLVMDNDKLKYIVRYNQWDGVPSESFVNGRSLMLEDGNIVMQGLDHVVEFKPANVFITNKENAFELYPKLVRMYVNGLDIKPGQKIGDHVILEKALSRTKEINLNYDQNTVSLTFSGLNYFRPQQTYYRARVTGPGMSGKWELYTPFEEQGRVDKAGQMHLPLVSLAPGTYTIEVQTSMSPNTWDTIPYEWIINIHEPWWRTTGIIGLLAFILFVLLLIYLYLYMKNANLRARRNSEEQGVIKRIKGFAERCDVKNGLLLEPLPEEIGGMDIDIASECDPAFVKVMMDLVPYMLKNDPKKMTMRELCGKVGMKLPEFYSLVTSNIYKNPRPVALQMMLNRAVEMMRTNKTKDILDISSECGFVTPNFFIATFYHKYHITPAEYFKGDYAI